MAGRREMEASSRRLGLVRPFMRHLNSHMHERRLSHEHLSYGSDRVDQGGMSRPRRRPGLSGGLFAAAALERGAFSLWSASNTAAPTPEPTRISMHLPTGTLPLNPTPSGRTRTYRPRYPSRAPPRYQRAASWSVAPTCAGELSCRCSVTAVVSSFVCV